MSEMLDIQKDNEERKNNVVAFNVDECQNEQDEEKHDRAEITNILNEIVPEFEPRHIATAEIVRLGKRKPFQPKEGQQTPKPRPIKIIFQNVEAKNKILKNARKLKNFPNLKKIGLSSDKNKKEREEDLKLRKELKSRRDGGEDVVMFNGKVMTKTEREELKSSPSSSD